MVAENVLLRIGCHVGDEIYIVHVRDGQEIRYRLHGVFGRIGIIVSEEMG